MAKTIGQLTQATTLASGDEFIIEQSGLTKRVAASVVRGGLVNADIDAAAAIAFSKLAALDSANILVGNGSNVATKVAVTGDVTISNAGVTAIGSSKVVTAMVADDAVTNDKLSLSSNAGEIKKAINSDNNPPIYACRAWVNFDGTRNEADTGASTNGANVKIRASGNVSSVLKNATGDYTVNFTTAMPDASYSVSMTHQFDQTDTATPAATIMEIGRHTTGVAAGSVRLTVANSAATKYDVPTGTVAIFR
jgi:hypothetical protein